MSGNSSLHNILVSLFNVGLRFCCLGSVQVPSIILSFNNKEMLKRQPRSTLCAPCTATTSRQTMLVSRAAGEHSRAAKDPDNPLRSEWNLKKSERRLENNFCGTVWAHAQKITEGTLVVKGTLKFFLLWTSVGSEVPEHFFLKGPKRKIKEVKSKHYVTLFRFKKVPGSLNSLIDCSTKWLMECDKQEDSANELIKQQTYQN